VPKLSEENFPTILSLAEKIKAIGAQHNATSAQVTLAWLLAQGDDIIPIPGSVSTLNLTSFGALICLLGVGRRKSSTLKKILAR
jgi:aryl-alcohol dehydrogenase-like predicted oxidoreductase